MADERKTALSEQQPAVPAGEGAPPVVAARKRREGMGTAAVTRRALVIGLVLVGFVAAFTPYNDYILRNSPFIGNHFPISVVFIVVSLIVAWNPMLRVVSRWPGAAIDAWVGAALTLGVLFLLHASECVPTMLGWAGHLGLEAAAKLGERLSQRAGELLLVNMAMAPLPIAAGYWMRRTRGWLRGLRLPLEPGELAVIMTMMLIGAAAPSSGLMRYLEPMLVTPFWHQRQFSWLGEVTALFPSWLVPSTDPGSAIVTNYWLGIDPVRGGRIPVAAFLVPELLWGILIAALMGSGMFLAAIFRRQWVQHERLTFPLATIPLELMAEPEEGRRFNALWRNPIMWTAAAIPIFVYLLAGLHGQFAGVPQIDLHFNLRESFRDRPWDALPAHLVESRLYFAAVGICFFIPSEVAFSLWLFVVMNGFLQVVFSRTSFDPGQQENTRAMGIYVAYFVGLVWLARGHLQVVAMSAIKNVPRSADEVLSYRTMVGGWMICMAVAWVWLVVAGMSWLMAIVLLGVGTMLITLMSRIVAETGLFWVGPTFWAKEIFITLLGRGVVGMRSFFWTEVTSRIFYADLRENVMPYTANSLRMAQDFPETDSVAGGRTKWFRWLVVALFVSILVSGMTNHYLSYTHGRAVMDNWASDSVPREALTETYAFEHTTPDASFATSWGHFGAGAGMAVGLMAGRMMWAAWPFHPIGLVLMSSGPMRVLWFSIFIGWGMKRLLLRYGGAGAFRRARPFFIGLIVGEILAAGFWMFVGLLTHGTVTYTLLPG